MKCPNCEAQNEENAYYCSNCEIVLFQKMDKKEDKSSDTLLLAFIIVAFIATTSQYLIQVLVENWYQSPTKYIQVLLWILQSISLILIPLAIKDKTFKTIGIILVLLISLRSIAANISFLMN